MKHRLLACVLLFAFGASGCRTEPALPSVPEGVPRIKEHAVTPLKLSGPVAANRAELSGLAWGGKSEDVLVMLPQYPDRFKGGPDGALFGLKRGDVERAIQTRQALTPFPIPFTAKGIEDKVAGYEGYEALVIRGDRVWLLIEGAQSPERPGGYLVEGRFTGVEQGIILDDKSLTVVPRQHTHDNKGYEALLASSAGLLAFYEVNGAPNPAPQAMVFRISADKAEVTSAVEAIEMPKLSYRLTDVSAVDAEGRFWALNYFWPGDASLAVKSEPLVNRYGIGSSHATRAHVERLLAFRIHEGPDSVKVTMEDRPPIVLELGETPRNWEGLVRVSGGFLLVTDKHPETLLGFVPDGDTP